MPASRTRFEGKEIGRNRKANQGGRAKSSIGKKIDRRGAQDAQAELEVSPEADGSLAVSVVPSP